MCDIAGKDAIADDTMTAKSPLVFVAAAGILLSSGQIAQSAEPMCDAHQKVFMYCKTKGGKVLSVCGSSNEPGKVTSLHYIFGSKVKVEMNFPTHPSSGLSDFYLYYDGLAKYSDTILTFSNKDYNYYVFDRRSSIEGQEEGVDVFKGEKRVSHILCDNDKSSTFGLYILYGSGVPSRKDVPEIEK